MACERIVEPSRDGLDAGGLVLMKRRLGRLSRRRVLDVGVLRGCVALARERLLLRRQVGRRINSDAVL